MSTDRPPRKPSSTVSCCCCWWWWWCWTSRSRMSNKWRSHVTENWLCTISVSVARRESIDKRSTDGQTDRHSESRHRLLYTSLDTRLRGRALLLAACAWMSVCPSVCHMPVLYWNVCTEQVVVCHARFPRLFYVLYTLQRHPGISDQEIIVGTSLWNFSETLDLDRFLSSLPVDVANVVNSWPTIVACWSHSASSFVYHVVGVVQSVARVPLQRLVSYDC